MQWYKVTYIENENHKVMTIEVFAHNYNDAFLTAWNTIGDYAGPESKTTGIISIEKLEKR